MSSTRTVSVRFADTALLYIVNRQQDYDKKNDVARNELWYTAADFHSMRQAVAQDVFHVRAQALAGLLSIMQAMTRAASAVLASRIS